MSAAAVVKARRWRWQTARTETRARCRQCGVSYRLTRQQLEVLNVLEASDLALHCPACKVAEGVAERRHG